MAPLPQVTLPLNLGRRASLRPVHLLLQPVELRQVLLEQPGARGELQGPLVVQPGCGIVPLGAGKHHSGSHELGAYGTDGTPNPLSQTDLWLSISS